MKKKGIRLKGVESAEQHGYVLEKEQKLFGINHALFGSLIAKKWDLPERIYTTVEYHHHPSFFSIDELPEEYVRDIAVVSIADQIINTLEGETILLPQPPPEYFDIIGLKPPVGNLITSELKAKLEKAKQFLTYIS